MPEYIVCGSNCVLAIDGLCRCKSVWHFGIVIIYLLPSPKKTNWIAERVVENKLNWVLSSHCHQVSTSQLFANRERIQWRRLCIHSLSWIRRLEAKEDSQWCECYAIILRLIGMEEHQYPLPTGFKWKGMKRRTAAFSSTPYWQRIGFQHMDSKLAISCFTKNILV